MTCTVCGYEWCWLCGSTYSDIHFSPLNPLGCAGMQDSRYTGISRCKIYLIRFLSFLGILILIPIVLPLFMVFVGPGLLVTYAYDRCTYQYGCCTRLILSFFIGIFGLLLDPFVWIGGLIYFVPKLCE